MQTFEEILQQEMAQPVRIKGSDATVTPQQAMIKSVMANAMNGDLSAIVFIRQMTRPAETDGDRQHQTAQQQLLADTLTLNQQREDRVPDHIDAMFQERYGYHFNRD